MASLDQRIGESIVAVLRAASSSGFTTLFGGTGNDFKVAYADRPPFFPAINHIFIQPATLPIPDRQYSATAKTSYEYAVEIRLTNLATLHQDVATACQGFAALFGDDDYAATGFSAKLTAADAESNRRGAGYEIELGNPSVEIGRGDVPNDTPPGTATVRFTFIARVYHRFPPVLA